MAYLPPQNFEAKNPFKKELAGATQFAGNK